MPDSRLHQQIRFIIEIDKLKTIFRQTRLTDGTRKENDAEHSWHIAVMALLLSEYTQEKDIDVFQVLQMILIHDLVEIDAGDTFCYDDEGNHHKLEREIRAADRIFNLLPPDQARHFRSLWEEFEDRQTAEARFAAALDRLQPLLHNIHTQGGTWREHRISREQVIRRNSPINDSSPALWEYAAGLIDEVFETEFPKT